MKFGAFIPQGWRFDLVGIADADQWGVMRDLARHLDAEPAWESLWVYDHFHTTPVPSEEATHEAWTLMAGLGAATSRIRLGQMCTCMSYRDPAYLAKVAATVDHICGGRVEMGIGGGWYEHEWRAYGYGFPSAGERLGRLREGVEIFQQAWTTGVATLDGTHYQVDGAIVRPLPVQRTSPRNNIPVWIAGGGEKVTLKIAAQYADYTNFAGTPEGFAAKSEILREHCEAVGRDFAEITRSANFNVYIGATEAEARQRVEAHRERLTGSIGAQKATEWFDANLPSALVGTPDQIVPRLTAFRELGLGYAIGYFAEAAYDHTGLDLFAREVIPALG